MPRPTLAAPREPWRLPSAEREELANVADPVAGLAGDPIAALAARQHGIVARRQLLAAGLSGAAIGRRCADGRLRRLHRGVYAVAHTSLRAAGWRLAAVLAGGPGAVLGFRSAGEAWSLVVDGRERHEIIVPAGGGRRLATVDVHRDRLHAGEITCLDGVPITTVARTVLDLAAVVSWARLLRAIERADVLRLLDRAEIDAVLGRAGNRRGVAALRRAISAYAPEPELTRSEFEVIAKAFARQHGLPRPLINEPVLGQEADLYWPQARVNLECDGWETHRTRAAYERDRQRDRWLQARGVCVVRVTVWQLRNERQAVADDLRRLLASRAG